MTPVEDELTKSLNDLNDYLQKNKPDHLYDLGKGAEEHKQIKKEKRIEWIITILFFLVGFILMRNTTGMSILNTLGFIGGLLMVTGAISFSFDELNGKEKNENTNK
jgi:small neutral amino acid transporter SnatA (MarC family)